MDTIISEGLKEFPNTFKSNNLFLVLNKYVQIITNHEAMLINKPHILDNMIRASLAFTVCFYGNLLSCLNFTVLNLFRPHPFRISKNNENLYLFLQMALGELATKNIQTKDNCYSPHYVSMLEAAQNANINTSQIELLVSQITSESSSLEFIKSKFHPDLIKYLTFSEKCTRSFEDSFATIALRELTLSDNFKVILNNLPNEDKFNGYKVFLSTHIEVDSNEHGVLMAKALEDVKDINRCLKTMIDFYKCRIKVYDACLSPNSIFL